jgi:hypothetical protein
MNHSEPLEVQLESLFNAVTDALLAGENANPELYRYDLPSAQVDPLVRLIRRLHLALVRQQPSEKFVRRLKQDLIGRKETVFDRLRYLPARVQIAAAFALIASSGVMLVLRRRLLGAGVEEHTEIPVLQQ